MTTSTRNALRNAMAGVSAALCGVFVFEGLTTPYWSYFLSAASWALLTVAWLRWPDHLAAPLLTPFGLESQRANDKKRLCNGIVGTAFTLMVLHSCLRWLVQV